MISACRCALELLDQLNGSVLWSESGASTVDVRASKHGRGAGAATSAAMAFAPATSRQQVDSFKSRTGNVLDKKEAKEERDVQKKLEKLRECSDDTSGFDTLNQVDDPQGPALVASPRGPRACAQRARLWLASLLGKPFWPCCDAC